MLLDTRQFGECRARYRFRPSLSESFTFTKGLLQDTHARYFHICLLLDAYSGHEIPYDIADWRSNGFTTFTPRAMLSFISQATRADDADVRGLRQATIPERDILEGKMVISRSSALTIQFLLPHAEFLLLRFYGLCFYRL